MQLPCLITGVHSPAWSLQDKGTTDGAAAVFPAVFPAEVVCRASPTAFTSLTQRSFCGSRPCELRVATGFVAQYKCPSCPFIGSRALASRHPKHGQRYRKQQTWRLEEDEEDNDSSLSEDQEAERENDCSSAEDEEAERENDCSGDEQGGGG
jgi:hypothetical protein